MLTAQNVKARMAAVSGPHPGLTRECGLSPQGCQEARGIRWLCSTL